MELKELTGQHLRCTSAVTASIHFILNNILIIKEFKLKLLEISSPVRKNLHGDLSLKFSNLFCLGSCLRTFHVGHMLLLNQRLLHGPLNTCYVYYTSSVFHNCFEYCCVRHGLNVSLWVDFSLRKNA